MGNSETGTANNLRYRTQLTRIQGLGGPDKRNCSKEEGTLPAKQAAYGVWSGGRQGFGFYCGIFA